MTDHNIKKQLFQIFDSNKAEIEGWFEGKYKNTSKLIYSSVDIRYSGYKIAPVDTNLFPAGFNLLNESQRKTASQKIREYFASNYAGKDKLLLVPENHTRNSFYLENVFCLQKIIEDADIEVIVGKDQEEELVELETSEKNILKIHKIHKSGDVLKTQSGFEADVVLVNNDLSSGSPEILDNISQPIFPPIGLGWYRRRKTSHFETYERLAREFSNQFGFDHWLISASFSKSKNIDFKTREGIDKLAVKVDEMLKSLKEKYSQHDIKHDPFLFIKANSGTYGMGIMNIKSADELFEINKKKRHSMSNIKEGAENNEVIIQEGVPTIDKYKDFTAEPLIYLVNSSPVGCTYRINNNQDEFGNLNSKGMSFVNSDDYKEAQNQTNCPVQSMIARIATLAAAQECYEVNWTI